MRCGVTWVLLVGLVGAAFLLPAPSGLADSIGESQPVQLPADHPLAKLKAGMTQQAVEKILGKPDRLTDGGVIGAEGTRFATYFLEVPKYPGKQMMTAHYKPGKGAWVFTEWRGPHIPVDQTSHRPGSPSSSVRQLLTK